jgi:hypothetical protein
MAMACLRLVTVLPLRPLFSVPFFFLCIARFTEALAFLPYLAMIASPEESNERRIRGVSSSIQEATFAPENQGRGAESLEAARPFSE